jgi:dipeptidyl aminopeptidase/acylaminoacyl peptidase
VNHYAVNGLDSDLYIIDVATGEATPLVTQPGWDATPVWSPDGRWIAFESQRGKKDWNYTSFLAVVPAGGGPIRYLDVEAQNKRASMASGLTWDAKSEGIYFTAMYGGRRPLFYASASITRDGKESVREVSSGSEFFNHYSVSPTANVVACSGETITTPSDVYGCQSHVAARRPAGDPERRVDERRL